MGIRVLIVECMRNAKNQFSSIQGILATQPRNWLAIGKSSEWHTCKACRGSWWVTTARALQGKTSSLAKQLARLVPVVRSSRQNALFVEKWLFAYLTHPTINTFIPMKCREFLERILREKPLSKIRLIYPQSLSFDSPNSSTLTISIDISLRGTFSQILISP